MRSGRKPKHSHWKKRLTGTKKLYGIDETSIGIRNTVLATAFFRAVEKPERVK